LGVEGERKTNERIVFIMELAGTEITTIITIVRLTLMI
jgi:hypothetical protein